MTSETKPFSLQSPETIAKEYGGNKQKIAQAVQNGLLDPTSAVLAGMFIDRMRSAQVQEQAQQQTVAQQVLTPQTAQAPGLQAIAPQGAPQMPQQAQPVPQAAPAVMPQQGGLEALPVDESMFTPSYNSGGIVAFASAGLVEDYIKKYRTRPPAGMSDEQIKAAIAFSAAPPIDFSARAVTPNYLGQDPAASAAKLAEEQRLAALMSPNKAELRPTTPTNTQYDALEMSRLASSLGRPSAPTASPVPVAAAPAGANPLNVLGTPERTAASSSAIEQARVAAAHPSAMSIRSDLPNRTRAWDAAITPYNDEIQKAAAQYGLDPVMFKRLIGSESSFNPSAASYKGAQYGLGIAQLNKDKGLTDEQRKDPAQALPVAAKYLAGLIKQKGGDAYEALMAYKGARSEKGRKSMEGVINEVLFGLDGNGPQQAALNAPSALDQLPAEEKNADVEAYRESLRKRGEDLEKQKKEDFWSAVAQFGFNMASSKSPSFLQAAGEAGKETMPTYAAATKARREAGEMSKKELANLALYEQAAREKRYESAAERASRERIGLGRTTETERIARSRAEILKAQGDPRDLDEITADEQLKLIGLKYEAGKTRAETAANKLTGDQMGKLREDATKIFSRYSQDPRAVGVMETVRRNAKAQGVTPTNEDYAKALSAAMEWYILRSN